MILKLCENDVLLGESSRCHIMGEKIKFVRNYNDLSTDSGFQFEFFCDRCGTGYRSEFKASASSGLGKAMPGVSGNYFILVEVLPGMWHQMLITVINPY